MKPGMIVLNRNYELPAEDPKAVCISVVHPTKPLRAMDIFMTVEQFGKFLVHDASVPCTFEISPQRREPYQDGETISF